MATLGILGSHLAGDFFLGVDILVTSMLVNFLLMALSVLALPRRNPGARRGRSRCCRRARAGAGRRARASSCSPAFLAVHTWQDLTGPAAAWYFRSTPVWARGDGASASFVYLARGAAARRAGRGSSRRAFAALPPE